MREEEKRKDKDKINRRQQDAKRGKVARRQEGMQNEKNEQKRRYNRTLGIGKTEEREDQEQKMEERRNVSTRIQS
jgi:hypothetical protein